MIFLASLTRQARLDLLRRILQISENSTTANLNANANLSIDLPGIDLDINLPVPGTGTSSPTAPSSLRTTLLRNLDQEVIIETSSGADVIGTLIAVENDYIVLVEAGTGSLTFVRIARIVSVQETEF